MEKIKQHIAGIFEVPWKKRIFWGLFWAIGLLVFSVFYRPYSMEGDMGVKIIICPFRNLTGLPCPGCGMTRAVYHFAHGDFATAFSLHLFVPVFFLAIFAEIVNSVVAILKRGKFLFYWGELFNRPVVKYFTYTFFVIIVTYNSYRIWKVIENASRFSDVFSDSFIYRFIHLVTSLR